MSSKEYLELLKTARENARRQYVLAPTLKQKIEWSQHSSRLFEKIAVAKAMEAQNENNSKSNN